MINVVLAAVIEGHRMYGALIVVDVINIILGIDGQKI